AWSTFVRNHAQAVLACDFFVAVTATFRMFYIFVVLFTPREGSTPSSGTSVRGLRFSVGGLAGKIGRARLSVN
ncbi:MAG: hypothetical protein ACRD1T_14410, partial [Acidimicrobiia bacterium]